MIQMLLNHTSHITFYTFHQLHMVFWDNKHYSTFDEAARGENGLAVVAVLFEVCNETGVN